MLIICCIINVIVTLYQSSIINHLKSFSFIKKNLALWVDHKWPSSGVGYYHLNYYHGDDDQDGDDINDDQDGDDER